MVGGGSRWWTLRSGVCSAAAREQLQRRAFFRALFVLDTAAQQSLRSEPCAESHAPVTCVVRTTTSPAPSTKPKEQHQTACVDGVMSLEGTIIIMY